ncbi:hypothetical protein [Sphaerisporangium perillae]|uniref:hypothetical protein n=1 Tax=Sphaerisporangium perillae TaxID=2935860 RepID=UPI00200E1673|nr:hypothetical protein [Sphaerisporangium perillae]
MLRAGGSPRSGKVRQGDSYTVDIATKGVRNGTSATVEGIDGKSYTVAVHDGKARKTLKVSNRTKPGSYTVTATVGNHDDADDLIVVKGKNHNSDKKH